MDTIQDGVDKLVAQYALLRLSLEVVLESAAFHVSQRIVFGFHQRLEPAHLDDWSEEAIAVSEFQKVLSLARPLPFIDIIHPAMYKPLL